MHVKLLPHYTLSAETLAKWIEGQPQAWWFVDGDPSLTSVIDFPCPGDEIAPEIRRIGKDLIVQDWKNTSKTAGEEISVDQLDALCDIRGRHPQKTLRLQWTDSDVDWLLIEDKESASCP